MKIWGHVPSYLSQADDAESLSPSSITGASVRTGSAYDKENAEYVHIKVTYQSRLGLGLHALWVVLDDHTSVVYLRSRWLHSRYIADFPKWWIVSMVFWGTYTCESDDKHNIVKWELARVPSKEFVILWIKSYVVLVNVGIQLVSS